MPSELRPGVETAPDEAPLDVSTPYVGHKAGDKRLAAARAALLDGEHLWAVANVSGLKPMLDMLVVTDIRAFAAYRADLDSKGPRAWITSDRIASVSIDGWGNAVTVRDAAGGEVWLGRLEKSQDVEPLRRRIELLAGRAVTSEHLIALHGGGAVGEATPPSSVVETVLAERQLSPLAQAAAATSYLPEGWPEEAADLWPGVRQQLIDAVAWTADGRADAAPLAFKQALNLVSKAPRAERNQLEAVIRAQIEQLRISGALETADDVPEEWPQKALDLWPQVRAHFRNAEAWTAEGKHDAAEGALARAVALKSSAPLAVRGKVADAIEAQIAERRRLGVLADPIHWRLNKASASAERGDRKAEEAAIWDARSVARKAGLASRGKASRSVEALIQERMQKGQLRRGVTRIGWIPASAQRPTSGTATGMVMAGLSGYKDLEVFSDRLIHTEMVYLLDGRESTALELDGQMVTSSRPTMTRMAAGSILPGSALLTGLAFQ